MNEQFKRDILGALKTHTDTEQLSRDRTAAQQRERVEWRSLFRTLASDVILPAMEEVRQLVDESGFDVKIEDTSADDRSPAVVFCIAPKQAAKAGAWNNHPRLAFLAVGDAVQIAKASTGELELHNRHAMGGVPAQRVTGDFVTEQVAELLKSTFGSAKLTP